VHIGEIEHLKASGNSLSSQSLRSPRRRAQSIAQVIAQSRLIFLRQPEWLLVQRMDLVLVTIEAGWRPEMRPIAVNSPGRPKTNVSWRRLKVDGVSTPHAAMAPTNPLAVGFSPVHRLSVATTAPVVAAAWMGVGFATMSAIPPPAPTVDPDVIMKPWASAPIDNSALAAGIADTAGPGERQGDQD